MAAAGEAACAFGGLENFCAGFERVRQAGDASLGDFAPIGPNEPNPDTSLTEAFQYIAGPGAADVTNFYNGLSAPGAGLAGLAFLIVEAAMTTAGGFFAR